MRPNKHLAEVLMRILPGGSFDKTQGTDLGKVLGQKNQDIQNPVHLSKIWHEKAATVRLNDARQLAFYIASVPLNLGAVGGGVATLAGVSKASMLFRYLAVVDVTSGIAGLTWSTVGLLGIKDYVKSFPPGPEKVCLQMAILVADASPQIGKFSVAHAPIKLGVAALTKFSLMVEIAKESGINWQKLGPAAIAGISKLTNAHLRDLMTEASNGGVKGMAQLIRQLAREAKN